jgi:hypothetical protein
MFELSSHINEKPFLNMEHGVYPEFLISVVVLAYISVQFHQIFCITVHRYYSLQFVTRSRSKMPDHELINKFLHFNIFEGGSKIIQKFNNTWSPGNILRR